MKKNKGKIFNVVFILFIAGIMIFLGITHKESVPAILGVIIFIIGIYLIIMYFVIGENIFIIENDNLRVHNNIKKYLIEKDKIVKVKLHKRIISNKIDYLSFTYNKKFFILDYDHMSESLMIYFNQFDKKITHNFFLRLVSFLIGNSQ